MIYLIITTSIINRYGVLNDISQREERYKYAINDTLEHLPSSITPIIVENNGHRPTYLDNFYHNNNKVQVIYTDNNKKIFKSKGVAEFLDIIEVINRIGIKDDDVIIKLTGRYRFLSNMFFKNIIQEEKLYDAFIKFYGTCSLKFDKNDCVLGVYVIRVLYLKLFNPLTIQNYSSAEIAFSKYIKLCGARIKEVDNIGLECCFADDLRILNV
jgi:hypothetical protein